MTTSGSPLVARKRGSAGALRRTSGSRAALCIAALGLCVCARSDRQEDRPLPPAVLESRKSPTCEQRYRAVEDLFATRNRCKQASDCELVWPQCPFGCYGAIERSHKDELFRLINEYLRHCTNCHYRCILLDSKDALCENGICKVPKH